MILIGSRALDYWGKLVGRNSADWDVICNPGATFEHKKTIVIEGQRVEYQWPTKEDESTQGLINYFNDYVHPKGETKYTYDIPGHHDVGHAIASLPMLKCLKLSSAPHLCKAKNYWDLQQLEDIELDI